eukprot:CAMPEP_0170103488 /NCGR_PEP_ID=MMETSP0020_2-20130122/3525_1 /TAXON_ID=98059 /ORGANISM="Dinobryon sp., Strain UTEXLB2267" /LENGTH=370 /DNA_ID=CAMNT_0010327067 /DNA_START=202 /DNA_END=1311 /DNA_ORIENTATION=-
MAWRILLLIGAIPAFLLLLLTIQETDELRNTSHNKSSIQSKGFSSNQFSSMDSSTISLSSRLERFSAQFRSHTFRSYLCGVSLSWFFSDLLHYGNLLYQVLFLDSLLSDKNTFDDDNYHFSIGILAAIGLGSATLFWLGGLLSILALRKVSALSLQLHGFILATAAFFLVSICKATLPKFLWPVTIAFYMSTYLLVGLGPAPTTFLVPSLLFSSSFSGIRSTANGLAAACGKLGAVVAVLTVGYAGFDIAVLMAFFGAVGVLGVGSTLFTIRAHIRSDTGHYSINSTINNNHNSIGSIQRSEYMQISCMNDGDMFDENDEGDDIIPPKDNEVGRSLQNTLIHESQEIRSKSGLIPDNNNFIQPKLSPVPA